MSASQTIIVGFPEAEVSRILVSYLSNEVEEGKEVVSSEEMVVVPSLPLDSSSLSTLTALPVPANTQARAILFASDNLAQVNANLVCKKNTKNINCKNMPLKTKQNFLRWPTPKSGAVWRSPSPPHSCNSPFHSLLLLVLVLPLLVPVHYLALLLLVRLSWPTCLAPWTRSGLLLQENNPFFSGNQGRYSLVLKTHL